ncbi:MAG: histone, partial [Nanoarchaeota archaeon]
ENYLNKPNSLNCMGDSILSAAAMEKLLKKAGAARVGEDAKAELARVLEEHAIKVGQNALRFTQHAKRKTITSADIREAARQ